MDTENQADAWAEPNPTSEIAPAEQGVQGCQDAVTQPGEQETGSGAQDCQGHQGVAVPPAEQETSSGAQTLQGESVDVTIAPCDGMQGCQSGDAVCTE